MLTASRIADHPPVSDTDYILQSAGALGVSEFNLFELADRWWHGDACPEKALERFFVHYLSTGTAPPWVRQFCRTVLDMAEAGNFDPRRFGASPLQTAPLESLERPNSLALGVGVPALLFGIFLLLTDSIG